MRRAVLLGLLAGGVLAAPAQATTFCVPTFHAACVNDGENVAQASLQTALNQDGSDDEADRIVIPAGLLTDIDAFTTNAGGTDDLELVGAGRAATILTTTQSGDNRVLDFAAGTRDITVRDLTVRIPASFTDNLGAAVDMRDDRFLGVDLESRNPGADGIRGAWEGGVFAGGRIYGSQGGSLDVGIAHVAPAASSFTVEDARIEHAATGISLGNNGSTLLVRRTRIVSPSVRGVHGAFGATAIENSIIETSGTAVPVLIESGGSPLTAASATLRHVTIAGTAVGDATPALHVKTSAGAGAGAASLSVTDSVVDGFKVGHERTAGSGTDTGDATITAGWSFLPHYGASAGDGSTTLTNTVNANFAPSPLGPDRRPFAGSPVIDAGDPAGALPADLDGTPRPLDGDGDGTARRDMGAFEAPAVPFVPVVTPPAPPAAGTATPPVAGRARDAVKPKVSRVRVDRGRRVLTLTLSEGARVEVTLKRSGRRAVKLRFRGKAGVNRFTIGKRKLRARRQQVTVVATDAAGNRSAAVRARLSVRR